ncbi:hypothetical protein ACJ72_08838 [Emergomyces africanus]|uniref:Uncharacterized protein n=1 Tax=Emergomyces africanus TaxID=1955775 RepID=A0A1B7NJ21_9EURO|nr:hypothetical protein ACJ72_08838 [Emergomyces africanus]
MANYVLSDVKRDERSDDEDEIELEEQQQDSIPTISAQSGDTTGALASASTSKNNGSAEPARITRRTVKEKENDGNGTSTPKAVANGGAAGSDQSVKYKKQHQR